LRDDLEKLSSSLDLQNVVLFKGHIPYESAGYSAQYMQADIFVLPCRAADGTKEGMPGTLIEAMASGLPVISTVHAGIPEVVRHNVDGLLVAEGSVDELADALGALIAHADLRRTLGRSAAQRAAEFDVRNQTKELEKIYTSLTGEEEKPKRKGGTQPPT
jgi:glycosyltransferase involved in cell wall biosynthesis